MFGASDVDFDHPIQLVPARQQTVVVQSEAGTLPRTVFNVVGLVQHQDLAGQVDIQLIQ